MSPSDSDLASVKPKIALAWDSNPQVPNHSIHCYVCDVAPTKYQAKYGKEFCITHYNHANLEDMILSKHIAENTTVSTPANDLINHPPHYTSHPSGIECIQITEHMDFCTGNAIKYIWRIGLKEGVDDLDNIDKAIWYLQRKRALIAQTGVKSV